MMFYAWEKGLLILAGAVMFMINEIMEYYNRKDRAR